MGRWHCYFLMLVHQALWVGIVVAALVVAVTVAGFVVSPWAGIASIGFDAFIVVMGVSFVISVYGFSSITGCNMPSHTIRILPDRVDIEFEDEKVISIEKKDIRPYKIYPGGVLVPFTGAHAGWIWVPSRIFETGADFTGFLKNLYRKDTENESDTGEK